MTRRKTQIAMIGLAVAALCAGQAAPTDADAAPDPTPRLAETAAPPAAGELTSAVRAHLDRFKSHTGLTDAELDRLAEVVVTEAARHQLSPELVLAVMHVESRYRNYAVSEKDAMGLMQILPSTGRWLAPQVGVDWQGPQTLFDPVANVRLGVAYLRQLADRYHGDLGAALAAYNWGPGHIDRRLATGVPLPEEYARLVFAAYDRNTRRS